METREKHVGDIIRQARGKMSRRAAATRAGVSESRLRQIENGVQVKDGVEQPAHTTAETLARIAYAVGLDKGELLVAAGFPADAADVVSSTPPASVVDVIDLKEFPDREAELIRVFVNGLKLGRTSNP